MEFGLQKTVHPTIRKCLKHLDVIQVDDKTKQIVYMYMETLLRERDMAMTLHQQNKEEIQSHNQ